MPVCDLGTVRSGQEAGWPRYMREKISVPVIERRLASPWVGAGVVVCDICFSDRSMAQDSPVGRTTVVRLPTQALQCHVDTGGPSRRVCRPEQVDGCTSSAAQVTNTWSLTSTVPYVSVTCLFLHSWHFPQAVAAVAHISLILHGGGGSKELVTEGRTVPLC